MGLMLKKLKLYLKRKMVYVKYVQVSQQNA